MKKKIKTAVIGAGSMGVNHTRIYSEISDLVAVSDIEPKLGKQVADKFNANYYKDYFEMLQKEKIEAVSVVVPTSLHKQIAIDCLKLNIPTLVEKPLSISSKDAKEIILTARKTNTLLTVGHIERFNPAVIRLKKLLYKKTFGKIVSIVIKRVGLYPPRIQDVNVVTDLAVHDLDIACDLINGLPNHIYATGGNSFNNPQMDYADIFLNFNKISCHIQVNWMTPIKIRTISITGTDGYAELDYISQKLLLYKTNSVDYNKPLQKLIYIRNEEPLKLELKNFLNAVVLKRKPAVSGIEGLRAVRLAEIVTKSISDNRLMKV